MITGRTKIVGVIGCPVEHSCSPQMHNAAFQYMGLDYVYVPFRVEQKDIKTAIIGLSALNVVGINVTVPHKTTVLPLMNSVSEEAKLIGAVNTILFRSDGSLEGHNTDAEGFIESLREEGISDFTSQKVLILGAGGSARAIVVGLAKNGVKNITVANRTYEKAVALATEMSQKMKINVESIPLSDPVGMKRCLRESDMVVSTISAGMQADFKPPLQPDWLHRDMIVYDIVYTPLETNLLKMALENGLKTINGIGMLVHQGAISFELWTGRRPPVDLMREALLTALTRKT